MLFLSDRVLVTMKRRRWLPGEELGKDIIRSGISKELENRRVQGKKRIRSLMIGVGGLGLGGIRRLGVGFYRRRLLLIGWFGSVLRGRDIAFEGRKCLE